VAQLDAGDTSQQVYACQTKQTIMFYLLAVLPGCCHPEDDTHQD
jgi:hypothetical protein